MATQTDKHLVHQPTQNQVDPMRGRESGATEMMNISTNGYISYSMDTQTSFNIATRMIISEIQNQVETMKARDSGVLESVEDPTNAMYL